MNFSRDESNSEDFSSSPKPVAHDAYECGLLDEANCAGCRCTRPLVRRLQPSLPLSVLDTSNERPSMRLPDGYRLVAQEVLEQNHDRLTRAEKAFQEETLLSNALAKALHDRGFDHVWDPNTRILTISQEISASSHWACDLCDRLWPKRAESIDKEEG